MRKDKIKNLLSLVDKTPVFMRSHARKKADLNLLAFMYGEEGFKILKSKIQTKCKRVI